MKRTLAPRALTFLGCTLLLLSVFEACSNNDDNSTLTVNGPPSISISKLSFGPGTVLAADGAPACGNPFGVTLSINNWLMKQAGLCESTPQCGQVRVTLLKGSDSTALATKVALSGGVDLNLAAPLEAGSYAITAELIDDDGKVFTITDAGSSSAQESFALNPAVDCPIGTANGIAGAAGTSSSSEGGAGGFGGTPPDLATGGTGDFTSGAGGT